jgi:hypothetical protein
VIEEMVYERIRVVVMEGRRSIGDTSLTVGEVALLVAKLLNGKDCRATRGAIRQAWEALLDLYSERETDISGLSEIGNPISRDVTQPFLRMARWFRASATRSWADSSSSSTSRNCEGWSTFVRTQL